MVAMKRRAPWQGTRSGVRSGFQRMGTKAGYGGSSAGSRRGRFASQGRYRKVGFWGRYPGAGGPARGGELKFHDIDWDEAVADMSNGVISNTSSLVLIGQGITEKTRIGRKCTIKSIGWRGELQLAKLAGTELQDGASVRLMICLDTQCNGAAPSPAGTNGVLAANDFQAFNNLTNKGRFTVLCDKVFSMNAQAGAGNGTADDCPMSRRSFSFFKKVNIVMEYSGTASPSDITEIRTNNIFGIMITGDSASTVSLGSKLRFRFSDD